MSKKCERIDCKTRYDMVIQLWLMLNINNSYDMVSYRKKRKLGPNTTLIDGIRGMMEVWDLQK